MASPMDIIRGGLLNQAFAPASLSQAFSPTLGPSAAPRGRSPLSSPVTEAGPPATAIPDLFGRPTAGPVTQAPDPIAPPPPPPPPPPPAGPSPGVMNQALMLQNILGGLGSTGLQPLWGLGGQTDPVYLQSAPFGSSAPFGGWASGLPSSQQGYGQWQPWLQSPGYSGLGPWGTGIQPINPHGGSSTWAQGNPYSYQSGQGWQLNPGYTSHQMAMQNSLSALAPELQGLAPIQALFNAPILGGSSGGGGGIYSGTTQGVPGPGTGGSGTAAGAWHPGGVSPMVNAAIQALSQWLMGQGT